jgi:hypothetical protein
MKQLVHARKALRCANIDIEAMKNAKNLADLREAWISFLKNINRSFNKAQAELDDVRKFRGWTERGRVLELIRQDPLLAYLKNARGAEEHGIKPLAKETPDSYTFKMNPGSRGFFVKKVEFRPDGYTNVEGVQGDVEVQVTPPKFELVPVTNRGRTYFVPVTHLGVPLSSAFPVALAEAGYLFYLDFFDKAKAEVLN